MTLSGLWECREGPARHRSQRVEGKMHRLE